jgi:hypothetical protein
MKTKSILGKGRGNPTISCFSASREELARREAAAHARAKALARQQEPDPERQEAAASEIGQYLLWHVDFPATFRLLVCDAFLFRLTADLAHELPEANDGQPLDYWDYGYVADILREALVDSPSLQGTLNLTRALRWVEAQGARKLLD